MLENEIVLLHRFAKTGDAEAFSEVVQRHAGLVYGACLRILSDRDRAADAVQDTFFQLLRNAGNITGSVPAWLHRVATRRAIDAVRRDSLRRRREAEYSANRPLEARKWQDISVYVDEGLSELDEQTQEILIQHFFEGQTMTDIAVGKGISQPTVSRRIESGVAELRDKLRKRGIIVAVTTLGGLLLENAAEAAPALVLKELGKMALVGGPAVASGVGSATAASGAGAKAAVGVLAGAKAKVVTAAVVTAVGVGSVVTYNHVTQPSEVEQPAEQNSTQQFRPSPSRRPQRTVQRRPNARKAPADKEAARLEWEMMMEMIFAEDTTAARPATSSLPVDSHSKESKIIYPGIPTPGMRPGFGGGFIAGHAYGEAEPNTPPGGYGGIGHGEGYGGGDGDPYDHDHYRDMPPEEIEYPNNNVNYGLPENRP